MLGCDIFQIMTEPYERRKLQANVRKRRLQPTRPIYFAAQRLSSTNRLHRMPR